MNGLHWSDRLLQYAKNTSSIMRGPSGSLLFLLIELTIYGWLNEV